MKSQIIIVCVLICLSFVYTQDVESNKFFEKVFDLNAFSKQIRDVMPDIPLDIHLKMIDASTKIPNGLEAGTFFDLGNFDECYNLEFNNHYGKYCLGTLSNGETSKFFKKSAFNTTANFSIPGITPRLAAAGPQYMGLHIARCVPDTLPAKDIFTFLNFRFTEEFCYSKATDPELSSGAITMIVVFSIFGAIILISTAFDIFLQATNQKPPHELLIAFSFWTNGKKIFKSSKNPDQLLCLNGIKAISMMWVIIGHEYSLSMNAPLSNFLDFLKWHDDSANMFVLGATVSVDTFFVVGGLVTVYTYLKSMDKGVKFNVILYYIHRFLRLTPGLVMMSLIHMYLINYMGNGPLWNVVDLTLVQPCYDSWWSTFLYINNYVKQGLCIGQSWYLDVDMQLYILSPLVLIPLFRWPKLSLAAMSALAVVGCIVPFVITYEENLTTGFNLNMQSPDYMPDYYMQTYTRFSPYVIGMIAGYYIYQIKKNKINLRLSKLMVCLLWLVLLTGLVSCVYAGYPLFVATKEDKLGDAFYNAFNRPAWGVCVAGVILLCVSGYGKPIDDFLSWPVFQFLTKVSYSMYLIHYTVITVRYSSMRNLIKFSNLALMDVFWADFMFTLFLSIIFCLSFESPIIIIEKYLFGGCASPKQVQDKKPQV